MGRKRKMERARERATDEWLRRTLSSLLVPDDDGEWWVVTPGVRGSSSRFREDALRTARGRAWQPDLSAIRSVCATEDRSGVNAS